MPVTINGSNTPTPGGVTYGDAVTAYATTAAGTAGQVLTSQGAAAPTWTTLAGFNPAYMGYTTRNGQGTTTVLTNASTIYQVFTGTGLSNSTVQLPVTSTLSVGWVFNIRNDTIVNVLVRSSDSSLVITIPYGTSATINCVATTGTTAANWRASISDFSTYTGVGNVVLHGNATIQNPNITTGLQLNGSTGTVGQVLTSAGSGDVPTWTTPASGGSLLRVTVFTSTGTWTKGAGTNFVKVYGVGGGGGGGGMGQEQNAAGGGGGAGGYFMEVISTSGVSTVSVTIGAGGTGGATGGGTTGSTGGTTSFGAYCSGNGGAGGQTSFSSGGAGGTATGGDLNVTGGGGSAAANNQANQVASGMGGASYFGGAGRGISQSATAGTNGAAYGSGGGGAVNASNNFSSLAGGTGASGVLVVEEYA